MIRHVRSTVVLALLLTAAMMSSGCSYNRFVGQEEAIKTQWAQVENQLQRRNDLIPNLVETTKGIAQQEKDVFGQIADSRARLAGARTPEETIQAANQQSAALARLLVVVENYPQLRSSETFNRLMDELSGTENRNRCRADALQRTRAGVQHGAASVPCERDRRPLRFQGVPALQRSDGRRTGPKVNFGKGTN
jgi:LemA protein